MNPITSITLKMLRRANAWHKQSRQQKAIDAFHKIRFEPGEIAIDCGANVGDVTLDLARRGATVYAFEPNPAAFAVLTERVQDFPAVHCRQQAVSDRAGSVQLYLHRKQTADPLYHSAGSSLVKDKHNLDPTRFIDVEAVDLAEFINSLPSRVRLLKIDVEGLEAVLVNHLIDRRVLRHVDRVFCETHEFKVPGLLGECRRLRRRLAAEGMTQVNLDWC